VVFGDELKLDANRDHATFSSHMVLLFWMLHPLDDRQLTSVAVMSLIYHHGLAQTQSWRRVLPGAVIGHRALVPATMIFGWYVTNYATYSVVYGSLSAAIALLVWLYIVSVIVLWGRR